MSYRNPYLLPATIVAGTIALCWFAGRYESNRLALDDWEAASLPLVIQIPEGDEQESLDLLADLGELPLPSSATSAELPFAPLPTPPQELPAADPATDVSSSSSPILFPELPADGAPDLELTKANEASEEATKPAEESAESRRPAWAGNWKKNQFYSAAAEAPQQAPLAESELPMQPERPGSGQDLLRAEEAAGPSPSSTAGSSSTANTDVARSAAPPQVQSASTETSELPESAFAPSQSPVEAGSPGSFTAATDESTNIATRGAEARVSAPAADSTATVEPELAESVLHRAVHHIEYGKSLARRGSSNSADREFMAAIYLLAQGRDEAVDSRQHTQALQMAVAALQEAGDFYVADPTQSHPGLVTRAISAHATRVIDPAEADSLTPVEAMQRYYAFAQRELSIAGGKNVVVAEALYALGRLHTVLAEQAQSDPLSLPRAIVYLRAALTADPNHYRSSNELGILLARTGEREEAKRLFQESLRVKPLPATWRNLAKLHQELGEDRLAQLAFSEYQLALQAPSQPGIDPAIQWKSPAEFNAQPETNRIESLAERPADAESPSSKRPRKGFRLF